MNNKYTYKIEDNKLYRLTVVDDDSPESPREWCNVSKMICFHSRYNLGDKHDYSDEEEFFKKICMEYLSITKINEIVSTYMEQLEIISPVIELPDPELYAKEKEEIKGNYDLLINMASKIKMNKATQTLLNEYRGILSSKESDYNKQVKDCQTYVIRNKVTNKIEHTYINNYEGNDPIEECNAYLDELQEELVCGDICYSYYGMYQELRKALSESDICLMNLYLYEHSGISISVSDFCDKFDSGQVGWAYVTKDDAFTNQLGKTCDDGSHISVDENNWREIAKYCIEAEVEVYDDYLRGEVYGYQIEVSDIEINILTQDSDIDEMDWEEEDSCYGFYPDHSHYDILDQISDEQFGKGKWKSSIEDLLESEVLV